MRWQLSFIRRISGVLLIAWLAIGTSSPAVPEEVSDGSIHAAREQLQRKYAALLHKRADELAAQSQTDAAQAVRTWAIDRRPGRNYFYLPSDDLRPAILDTDDALRKLQRFYAEHLMRLARQALAQEHRGLAYQLANEALRADPEHGLAAAVVNAADEKRLDVNQIRNGWEIETDHFEITSRADDEAAKIVGQRLEELHAVWRQLFAEYWFTQAELERRFAGQPSRLVEPNHKVLLFADKQQYVDYLIRDEPGIAVSLGYYAERPRTAFFYDDEQTLATQFHEATHQLFHERQRRGRPAGIDNNFWVVEGVATYMESLQKGPGYFVVGGPGAYRLQFARYRALTEDFYVPLAELVAMGRDDMKRAGDRLSRLYSQSAGLAHFFMDAGGGKYREAFVEYLDAVYRDKADAATLSRLTGKRYEQLDREYLEYLRANDTDLAGLIPGEHVLRLYLGHTEITDKAMEHIAGIRGLERLDVGHCPISDKGLQQLPPCETLVQLNLEQTAVTDASLPHVAKFKSLRELDLSGCEITDAGAANLATLKNLEILWLTDTAISDEGLAHLHGLKNLKFVDVSGSRVTPAGWAKLRQALPGISNEQ